MDSVKAADEKQETEKQDTKQCDDEIKEGKPCICIVEKSYLQYMHNFDWRVSVKFNGRKFVGVINEINGFNYVIPLTSQTTAKRKAEGKKKRSALITTFISDGKEEIANLLYNNMFPAPMEVLERVKIDPEVDTYLENENRYIRKKWPDILSKAKKVFIERYDEKSKNKAFLEKQCCDFKKLEEKCIEWSDRNK